MIRAMGEREEQGRGLGECYVLHRVIRVGLIEKSDFPGGSDGKNVCLQCGRPGVDSWVGKIPWRRKWQPTPVLLPGKSHGWKSLVGYNPWGHKESDSTEPFHFLSFFSH